jgi:hypothetical protein
MGAGKSEVLPPASCKINYLQVNVTVFGVLSI